MTELEKIEALGSLDVIKAKRAHRRGRITRLQGRIEALILEPLCNLQLEELEAVKAELDREISFTSLYNLALRRYLRKTIQFPKQS